MNGLFHDLFIFEMANNHQGSVKHGLNIIKAMGKIARTNNIIAGVKFQYRALESFVHPDYKKRKDVKHIPRFFDTRLPDKDYVTLVDAVRDQGMKVICTPFDEESVHKCVDHGVEILKVASCSADDWPLLEEIAKTQKPVIVSTGGQTIYYIDNIVSFFSHRHIYFALMHCVGLYPTPNKMVCMNFLSKMIRRYPYISVGYSGHEAPENYDVVKVAVSKGAQIIERHIGLPTDSITLNAYSMNPEQTDLWVKSAIAAKEICGDSDGKQISQSEIDSLLSLKRGVYAARNISKDKLIQKKDVFFAMPCEDGQTSSGEFGQKRATFNASKSYKPNQMVKEQRQPDTINMVRGIIHDAKGMIYEAGIVFGDDYSVEISHHYGIEQFRSTGAVIVNLINREYCKKIIVQLPGQSHPNHQHKVKEETFQLLWGELTVNLNGRQIQMKPGDKVLVERNAFHSFYASNKGAIFEEVSTTHIANDSYYEDNKIAELDPLQRKTVIENW